MNPITQHTQTAHETSVQNERNQPLSSGPIDNSIRIKTITHIAWTALSITSAVGALAGLAFVSLGVAVTTMASVAYVSAVALSVLLAAKAWNQWTPLLPEPLRVIANYIQSIVTGLFSIITLGLIFPINLEIEDPKVAQDCLPHQPPILLIHGFCGSSNNWLYHRQRLLGAGYKNIFTINLGSPLLSIEQYTDLVKQKVAQIQQITGQREIHIIGHSMGGLVGRCYRYKYAEAQKINVRKIITIGTPLDGTYTAYLASWFSASAKQMEPASSFVQEQQKKARGDDLTEYFHIGTQVDSIVLPTSSALQGGGRQMKTAVLQATGHIEYLFSDATADLVINELRNSGPA